ncbi:hypothetical protein P3T76_015569 [Phytophthora citrophthora]|uniref:Uncharacterized protein n=1 Tax=Phytophthora citrophthora TaxID=4793 RepID=A0AAD9LB87_9STRA|nr:hypothetical protein P3T76_015569 [Phytophthora citrophthora]
MLRALTAPCTDPPVRTPWMPTEAQIHDRFGASSPPNPILLYSCNSINDDDVAKEVDFESETQRRDYYIGLFHELRYFAAKKTSRKSKVPEWQALCQSWNAFVDNFNKDPKAYRERVVATRDRFYTYTSRGKCERLHDQSMEAGISCAVLFGTFCPCCPPGAARLSESDLTGYTLTRVPDHIKGSVLVSSHAKLRVLWSTAALPVQDLILQVMVGFVRPHHFRNVLHQDVPRLPRVSLGRKSSPTNTKTNLLRVRSLMSHDPLHNPADRSTRVAQRRRRGRKHSLCKVNAMTTTIVPCTMELLH